jgi:hypothetical protein
MSLSRQLGFAALMVICCPWSVSQAGVFVGVGFPGPGYYRPYGYGYRHGYGYGYGYGGYYRPYGFGVVVAPPPVVIGGPPVVVQQQPVVVQPAYAPATPPAQAPAPLPAPTPVTSAPPSSEPEVMPAALATGNVGGDVDACLRQLRGGDEQSRADALVQLGRLRAEQVIGPMVKALNSDTSPKVREAAARGLGLIGSATALSALQYAAQADDDREVRHSASFAAESIRGNLRR